MNLPAARIAASSARAASTMLVKAVGDKIGHSHGKDTLEIPANKALIGMLESRLPGDPTLGCCHWRPSLLGRCGGAMPSPR